MPHNTQQDRQDSIAKAQQYLSSNPVVLDTETTGLDNRAEIIEIAIIDQNGKPLLDTLIKPQAKIPPDATRIHGISDEQVSGAPSWKEIWPTIQTVLHDRTVVIYNADYDLRMMRQSLPSQSPSNALAFFTPVCLMRIYAQFYGSWNSQRNSYRWQSLANAGRQAGLNLPNTHRALDDCLLTLALLQYMSNQN